MNTQNLKSEIKKALDGFNPFNSLHYYFPINHDPAHAESNRLRMFKNGHRQALRHYYYAVQVWMRYSIKTPHLAIAVPSSNATKRNSITKITAALHLNFKMISDGTGALTKLHNTKSFCKTNQREIEKLKASFEIDQEQVKGKNILLLDDVTSTGKTFRVIEEMLIEAGAASVTCLSLAKTVKLKNL